MAVAFDQESGHPLNVAVAAMGLDLLENHSPNFDCPHN
jgi:hypothetical protein